MSFITSLFNLKLSDTPIPPPPSTDNATPPPAAPEIEMSEADETTDAGSNWSSNSVCGSPSSTPRKIDTPPPSTHGPERMEQAMHILERLAGSGTSYSSDPAFSYPYNRDIDDSAQSSSSSSLPASIPSCSQKRIRLKPLTPHFLQKAFAGASFHLGFQGEYFLSVAISTRITNSEPEKPRTRQQHSVLTIAYTEQGWCLSTDMYYSYAFLPFERLDLLDKIIAGYLLRSPEVAEERRTLLWKLIQRG